MLGMGGVVASSIGMCDIDIRPVSETPCFNVLKRAGFFFFKVLFPI